MAAGVFLELQLVSGLQFPRMPPSMRGAGSPGGELRAKLRRSRGASCDHSETAPMGACPALAPPLASPSGSLAPCCRGAGCHGLPEVACIGARRPLPNQSGLRGLRWWIGCWVGWGRRVRGLLPAMSQGPSETATELELELVEESLSAATYGSDTETKPKKKSSRKPPKSPKSPYSSSTCLHPKKPSFLRSFKGAESRRFDIPLGKASKLWRESLRQDAWVRQTKSDPDVGLARSALSDDTPEYLKEALGMKKPKHARFATNGYIPGTPNYKEKEEMYDEIIQLKKEIQAQKCEADQMKTKLRRLEEENNRKDRQLEQLLDPSRGSEFIGVWTEPKNHSSWVINSLKQKILKLEQQCKEKDNTINKLQTDIRTTNTEEMRISLETCYEEIQRLQTLVVKSKSVGQKYVYFLLVVCMGISVWGLIYTLY